MNIKLIIGDLLKGVYKCWIFVVVFCSASINGWLPEPDGAIPLNLNYSDFMKVYVNSLVIYMITLFGINIIFINKYKKIIQIKTVCEVPGGKACKKN